MIAGLAGPRMATPRDRLVATLIFDKVLALQLLLGTAGFGRNSLFYSLVFLHALAALAGFGSIGFAGTYAAGAYLPGDRPGDEVLEPASGPAGPVGPTAPGGLAGPEGTAVAQPADETAQPGVGDAGRGEVVPAESAPAAPAVPDYETALRQYHAALHEFETSDLEDEGPATVGQAPGPVGQVPGPGGQVLPGTAAAAATGPAEEVPSVADEAVVAEVIIGTAPPTSEAFEQAAEQAVEQTVEHGEERAGELDVEDEEMRRYFAHPARLWPCLILVPFLGAGALAAQPNGKGFDQPWVFGALAVWLAATLIAGSLVVPSLHQMQVVLLKSDNPGASTAARSSLAVRFARAGRIASRSAAFCDVLFLVALGLMIFRP
jgi:hypothetical protein